MLVTMSDKDPPLTGDRQFVKKRLRRRDAASQLGISERQAQRLINRYRVSGAEGLVSRNGSPATAG
jgi:transposase